MRLTLKKFLTLENGQKIMIKSLLGEGAQGEVYLVSNEQKEYAFKWYKNRPTDDFINNLKSLIATNSPTNDFIWPLHYVEDVDGFGYVMELIPHHFKSFVSLLNGKNPFKSLNALITWCIHLAQSFKELHSLGFSYQDVNDGGFFFQPETGDLLICDNDNITANKSNLGIRGKMKFMAPEIVRHEQDPDIHSDRFSLSIIFFMVLTLGHPFIGNRLKDYNLIDEKAEFELFGSNPIYVYHPKNASNRPIHGYHNLLIQRYSTLPSYIQDEFQRTFCSGLVDRENERTTELEWIKVLVKYRDDLIQCSHCQYEFPSKLVDGKLEQFCPRCHTTQPSHLILEIGRNKIVLEPDKKLYEPHIDKFSPHYETSVGIVVVNKNNPRLWGIRNLTQKTWTYRDGSGEQREAKPQEVIPIIRNLIIDFNFETTGHIH